MSDFIDFVGSAKANAMNAIAKEVAVEPTEGRRLMLKQYLNNLADPPWLREVSELSTWMRLKVWWSRWKG